jgi:hypothetical protein
MQNITARLLVALAFIMSGTLLITGSRIYGVLYLPPSEQLSVWPLWVVALAPITGRLGVASACDKVRSEVTQTRASRRVAELSTEPLRPPGTVVMSDAIRAHSPLCAWKEVHAGFSTCVRQYRVCVRNEEPAHPANCTG